MHGTVRNHARDHTPYRQQSWRGWRVLFLLLVATCGAVAWHDTFGPPSVRYDTVTLPGLAPGTPPVRLLLMSDIHVAGPDMTPSRLGSIVGQVNALHPDIVVITGDFVSDKPWATRWYDTPSAVGVLANLRARWGTYAVLGNHDHDRNGKAMLAALTAMRVHVLMNAAARVGPITLGGYDDAVTANDRPAQTNAAMHALGPPYVALSHSPEILPQVPADVHLLLAGHTHCGQVTVPFWGPVVGDTKVGWRYVCGRVDDPGRTTIVTAGLGTSGIPLRFGARPEVRVITLIAPPRR